MPRNPDRLAASSTRLNDEEAGIYNDLAVFAHFIVNAFSKNETARFPAVFQVIEALPSDGTEEVKGAAGIGFLEDLQNIASWQPFGSDAFLPWFGPNSLEVWKYLKSIWAGKKASWM